MRIGTAALAVVAICVSLCGACSTTTTNHLLDNLAGCERHYDGTVSGGMTGGQFAGKVNIDCPKAVVATAPQTPPPPAPTPPA